MPGSSFGLLLRLTTFGESHGPAIGGVIDGFPPGIRIDFDEVAGHMERRRPGTSQVTTSRNEPDQVEFLSGFSENTSLGTPIGFIIRNKDQKSSDYDSLRDVYRPSHADFTYEKKYGIREAAGGGRSSARETACRVVAGSLARQMLEQKGLTLQGWVSAAGTISLPAGYHPPETFETNPVCCPDPAIAGKMIRHISELKEKGDSCGGIISLRISGCMPGLGDPVFDKLHADLAKAILSINACKGIEFGSGFEGSRMKGSEHNDPFEATEDGNIRTGTNNSGGIQGGISNGMDILLRAAFKPPSTIALPQESVNLKGEKTIFSATGRHDPCVVPRAVVIVESMAALVLADHYLRQKSIT